MLPLTFFSARRLGSRPTTIVPNMSSPQGECHYNFPLLPHTREPGYKCGCRMFRAMENPRLPDPSRLDVTPNIINGECQCGHAACFHDQSLVPTQTRIFTLPAMSFLATFGDEEPNSGRQGIRLLTTPDNRPPHPVGLQRHDRHIGLLSRRQPPFDANQRGSTSPTRPSESQKRKHANREGGLENHNYRDNIVDNQDIGEEAAWEDVGKRQRKKKTNRTHKKKKNHNAHGCDSPPDDTSEQKRDLPSEDDDSPVRLAETLA